MGHSRVAQHLGATDEADTVIKIDLLVDTDVLIDHLRGYAELRAPPGAGHVSVITRAELFAGPEDQFADVRRLLATLTELELTPEVAERAGAIRRVTGVLLPDALIAATGLVNGLPVMTRNKRDFDQVDGLELLDPPTPRTDEEPTQLGG